MTPIFDQLCRDLGYTPTRPAPRFTIRRVPNIPAFGGVSEAAWVWVLRDREHPEYVGRFGGHEAAVVGMDALLRGEKVAA